MLCTCSTATKGWENTGQMHELMAVLKMSTSKQSNNPKRTKIKQNKVNLCEKKTPGLSINCKGWKSRDA